MTDPFLLFGLTTTPLELISFLLSAICVWLNIRQSHWGWLFAIGSAATYGVVFFESKLYGDMGLQGFFIVVSCWGWYQWLRGGENHSALTVSILTRMQWIASIAGWTLGFFLLAWFLKSYTDTDVPHLDGFLTAGSLAAQILMSRKKIENWLFWIVVDVLYVGLYLYKMLFFTAILYVLFIGMALVGWRAWARDHAQQVKAEDQKKMEQAA